MERSGYLVDDEVIGGYGNLRGRKVTQLVAIKNFCRECQGGHLEDWVDLDGNIIKGTQSLKDVESCPSTTCWLHPFRLGKTTHKRVRKGASSAI